MLTAFVTLFPYAWAVVRAFGLAGLGITSIIANYTACQQDFSHANVGIVAGLNGMTSNKDGRSFPLLHVKPFGKGRIAYLASLDSVELTQQVMDWLAGPMPITVAPAGKQVILAHQAKQNRWVLHLLSEGNYTVEIRRDFAPVKSVVGRYPGSDWSHGLEKTDAGLRIKVAGSAKDRLLVLR